MQLNTRYGKFGGCYAPENLLNILTEIEDGFIRFIKDEEQLNGYHQLLKDFAGRETPLTYASNLSRKYDCEFYLKREDLLHGGAHKTNNTIGQLLLAKFLGKKRIIAETGAGQHGVATAMTAAKLGLDVEIYMGAVDIERQKTNVQRMKIFGATVHPVTSGGATLKDAINDAMRDWIKNSEDTYYCFGTAAGPHPFPSLVRFFQKVIGEETKRQLNALKIDSPDALFACVGGGSNAIGFYAPFLEDEDVKIFGAEPGGLSIESGEHAATLTQGTEGVFHGMHSLFLQNEEGQIKEPYSISAGLDYPGIGPEHAFLKDSGRVDYFSVTDREAIIAFEELTLEEGIIPAIESAHAVSLAIKYAKDSKQKKTIVINISGRGDKDIDSYIKYKQGVN